MPPDPATPPVGVATKSGLGTAGLAFAAGAVNLLSNGPIEETVTLLGGGFATVLGVMVGRYWQAAKVPAGVERVADLVDDLLERRMSEPARPPG